MEKASIVVFIVCIGFFYFIKSDVAEVKQDIITINNAIGYVKIEQSAISKRLDVRELDKLYELKLSKNAEVLGDISCGKCHNSSDTALPIRKISVSEAINIVRFGSEKSQAGGMPIYKSFNNGKDAFISDSGLKQRLENLYTDDLLRTAVSKDR